LQFPFRPIGPGGTKQLNLFLFQRLALEKKPTLGHAREFCFLFACLRSWQQFLPVMLKKQASFINKLRFRVQSYASQNQGFSASNSLVATNHQVWYKGSWLK
jgi:hypothetical protein